MPRIFIFSQQVQQILKSGKKEIEIPEGARISAAAADLIKENRLRIRSLAPGVKSETGKTQSEGKQAQGKTDKETPVSKTTEKESPGKTGAEVTEAFLEDLVNRVVERFKQMRGIESPRTTRKTVEQIQAASAPEPAADDDMIICRCEEITKGEIKNAIRDGMQTLNGIKRITRAGMGLCQGQTCQRLVTQLLAEELGRSAAEVEPITARGPVRPLRMAVFANR